jgi:hypothetical protein
MIGDSHAWQWSTSVSLIASRLGASFGLVYRSGCFVTFTANELGYLGARGVVPSPSACQRWTLRAVQWLKNFDPQIVIVVATSPDAPSMAPTYERGLVMMLRALSAPKRRLIVIGDMPQLAQDGPACLATFENEIWKCATSESTAVTGFQVADDWAAATMAGAKFVDVVPWLCTVTECPAVIGKYEVYSDKYHLTSAYANSLSRILQFTMGLR